MKRKQHKWLLRKVSGSRGKYAYKPDFADTRHQKNTQAEILPYRESMPKRGGTHLDTTLVKRWLHGQVGRDFDLVYSDFLKRIQPKYLESYKECIYYYVTKAHELVFDETSLVVEPFSNLFYINPNSNVLEKHSELVLKRAKNIYLISPSTYCTFLYQKAMKQWESQRVEMCTIVIRDIEKRLTKDDFSTIDYVINNIDKLRKSGEQAMNSFALKYRNTDILLSQKNLFLIHFDMNKGLGTYTLWYEVVKDSSKDWKVTFEGKKALDIQRVRKGSLLL